MNPNLKLLSRVPIIKCRASKSKARICAITYAKEPIELVSAVNSAQKLVLDLSFKAKGACEGGAIQVWQAPFLVG